MDVAKEIERHADPKDKAVLLWLMTHYPSSASWPFLARCEHIRWGTQSYQTHRKWTPTREGRILYNHLRED